MKFANHLKTALDGYMSTYPKGDDSVSYFQHEALKGIQQNIGTNLNHQTQDEKNFAYYLHMFTSTGKTRIAIKLMELATDTTGLPPKTIIAVPKREDIIRIVDEIEKFAPHLSPYVGKFYSAEKNPSAQIIVTTNTSFERGSSNGIFNTDTTELLILDEVHESITSRRRAATLAHKNAIKIGLTATPDFSFERKVSNHFQQAYNLTHEEAFKRRAVAPHRSIILKTSSDLDDIPLDEFKNYNQELLEKKLNTLARHKQALEHYTTYVSPETGIPFLGQQALFNCLGIKDAQDMAKHGNLFCQKLMPDGIQFCAAVWGVMPHKEYEDIMLRFKAGKIMTLAQVDLLTTSFNHQPLSIAYNMAPSKSARVVGQRGGRIGRLNPANPNKIGYIVEMIDSATDPSKYPLLYAEYLNGARFGEISDISNQFRKASLKSAKDEDVQTVVIDDPMDIMNFIKIRREEIIEMNRDKLIDDKVNPAIRSHMNRLGINSVYTLFKKCKNSILDAKAITGDESNTTYDRFQRIVKGITLAWDLKSGVATIEADVIATLFETSIEALFGTAHNSIGHGKSYDYPYNKDFRKHFTRLMKNAGFTSIGQLKNAIWLKDDEGNRKIVSPSLISALSTGQLYPFSNDGQWTELAQEVACVLNVLPEELFQIDEIEPTFEKNEHLNQIDENENWEFDDDSMTWIQADDGGEEKDTPEMILALVKRSFNIHARLDHNGKTRPLHPSDNFRLVANINPQTPKSAEELYDLKELRKEITRSASPRTALIMNTLYGLDIRESTLGHAEDVKSDRYSLSVEDVGEIFNISCERVREIERKFYRKARHISYRDRLLGYL